MSVPGIDKQLAFSAEGGFDTPAKRSQMSVDLSSVAELMKSFGSSLGGTVTGDLGSPEDWKLEVIQDGDIAYVHFPLLAKQLPGGQDLDQGRRQDALERRRRPAEAVRLVRRHRPARRLRRCSRPSPARSRRSARTRSAASRRATTRRRSTSAKLEQLVPAAQRQSLGGLDQSASRQGRRDPARGLDRRRPAGPQALDRRRREAAGHLDVGEGIARRRALRLRQGARARAAAGRSGRRRGDAEAHSQRLGTTAPSVTLEA